MNTVYMKKISDASYVLLSELNEKIGLLVDYTENQDEDSSGFELFTTDGNIKVQSLPELEEILNCKFIEKEEDLSTKSYTNDIDGYPVNDTDTIIDIQYDALTGLKTFRKSERSKTRFYPGWWIVTPNGSPTKPRLTISTKTYEDETVIKTGPYKTYMEVTYNLKKS